MIKWFYVVIKTHIILLKVDKLNITINIYLIMQHNTYNFIIVILLLINIFSFIYNIFKNYMNDVSYKLPFSYIIINNNDNIMVLCQNEETCDIINVDDIFDQGL